MVYCIGLTGNIASGKSSVASFFENLGIAIFSADFISKQLTQIGKEAYNEIINHFGSVVIQEDQQLNRKKLREIIFNNPNERFWLEQLLHPMIRKQLAQEVKLCCSPYCIVEIPLLQNKTHYPYIQRILLVTSSLDIQVERIMKRDQCTREQALAIISTQPSNEQRLNYADDVLINNEGLLQLKIKVEQLHLYYLQQAAING